MGKSLLQRLYDGEVFPAEQILPKTRSYREIARKLGQEREYIRERLSQGDRERFDAMESLSLELADIYGHEEFSYGFRLGAALMIEVLVDSAD